MNILILLGMPGAGKTTQSLLIKDRLNYAHLSTGDIIREEIENATELGIKYKDLIAMGEFVSDKIIMEFIENRLKAGSDLPGFIFDGFPRTLEQAKLFDGLAEKMDLMPLQIIALFVTEGEAVNRLLKRSETSGRKDDNRETIGKRIEIFYERTDPVIEYYADSGRLNITDGMLPVDAVFSHVLSITSADSFI